MAGNSLDSLLKWMENPNNNVMWNWDSIAAMSRGKTNTLLLQEYIARFTGSSYLPPISGEVEMVEGQWKEHIHDYLLDAPRLSFENASLNGSIARLTCAILGGSQLSMKHNVDLWQVAKVFEIDPLQGPKLLLDLDLAEVPGNVEADGRVLLDLARSDNFKLTFAETEHEQRLGGDFFKDLFNQLPDEKRIWVMGRIEGGGQAPLRPKSFKLRTQANSQASRDPLGADYGDGAILIFICMTGGRPGGTPSDEYRYLIPDESGEDYSATVLFSRQRGTLGVLANTFASIINNDDFASVLDESGHLLEFTATTGQLNVPEFSYSALIKPVGDEPAKLITINMGAFVLPVNEDHPVSIRWLEGESSAAINWRTWGKSITTFSTPGEESVVIEVPYGIELSAAYRLEGDEEGVVLRLTRFDVGRGLAEINSEGQSLQGGGWGDIFIPIAKGIVLALLHDFVVKTYIEVALLMKINYLAAANSFIKEHIRLNFGKAIEGDVIRAPRDIGFFGRINPTRTSFQINPMQPLMAAGGSLQFTTEPVVAGLTWGVAALPGENGNVGTITQDGRYQAPAEGAIDGRFIRVRITATDPRTLYYSSALVTVLVNELTINPLIQLCDYAHSVELAAGGLGTGQLHWAIKNPVPGESGQVLPSERPDGDHRYVAGPKVEDKTFVLDEIEVSNPATGGKRSAWVLAIQKLPGLQIRPVKEAGLPLPPGQIRLQAIVNNNVMEAEWTLPMGGPGLIGLYPDDQKYGLYRADPAKSERFVLIFAVVDGGPFGKFEGHIILPLPLDGFPAELKLMTA